MWEIFLEELLCAGEKPRDAEEAEYCYVIIIIKVMTVRKKSNRVQLKIVE